MIFWICYILAIIPILLLFRIKVKGKANLKKLNKQNYILACNHMSNYDPFMLDIILHKKIHFLSKKQLFDNKFKAFFMRALGGHPVDKDKFNPKSIKEILNLIEKKKTVGIFPQGKRCVSPIIEDGEAKEGVAMFAVRTGTPVVPMALSKKIKPFRKLTLYIGEPIWPDKERIKDKEYQTEFSNEMVKQINKLLEGENYENERF